MPEKTLFTKIIEGDLPAKFEHQDDLCVAIHDINPSAPLHLLIIPRKPIPSINELEETDRPLISHLIYTARSLAQTHSLAGYKLTFHVGERGGQEIPHLHLHLLGWPE